jgi:NTP pyrophosphatase (non-canonical NTP hydrolase)
MLNELGTQIIAINTANGWNIAKPLDWSDPYKIPAILALITSEVSEALEAFRQDEREHFTEECADIIIRVLDLTAGMGIDIEAAIAAKLAQNKHRGYKHGGKRI